MLFLDYWPLRRMEFEKWRGAGVLRLALEKWPFFLLAAGSCVVTVLAQHKAVSSLAIVPFSFRLENAATAYVSYLWKMVWPQDLAIFYPLRAPIAWPWVAEAVIILAGISVIVWRERKGSPWLLVGWLWFLVTLVPVIGLVQVGAQAMADRYTYFPLIGIFLALAFAAQALAGRFAWLKPWLASAGVLVLGACLVLTEKQLRYWSDSKTLFTHALAVAESDIAHICLGSALQDQNRKSEAMTQYLLALQLNPQSAQACSDLANLLDEEGKPEAARWYCEAAVQRNPRSPKTHENLGIVLGETGHFDEALKEFSAAALADPTDAHPHFLAGQLLLQLGRDAEAVAQLREALKLDPADGQTLVFTASVLAAAENPRVRDGAEACVLAAKVVRLTHGQQPAALDAQAMACAETGRFGEAVLIQQQAVKLMAATGSKEDIAVMQKRLQLYLQHQPWRESFKKN
jgi:Flp pilus assembly protein TadD